MNFWAPYPFVRITAVLILGILSQRIVGDSQIPYALGVVITTGGFLIAFLIGKHFRGAIRRHLVGFAGLSAIFILGYHYGLESAKAPPSLPDHVVGYSGIVNSNPENKGQYVRCQVRLKSIHFADSMANDDREVILYIKQDSLQGSSLRYGSVVVVNSRPREIKPPTNPGQFDFSKFWGLKQIYAQDFVLKDQVREVDYSPSNGLLAFSFGLRNQFVSYLSAALESPRELAIAQALILGVRDGLNNEIKDAYSAAGAMHVLAVSGLHVGIMYLLIGLIFRPLLKYRNGKNWVGAIALMLLWLYALITGLSPSVQRATAMFSVVIIGDMAGRKGNIYNTLAFSAFVLILMNPMVVYEVGFQLSYLAVFGIVFFQPRLYRLWRPSYWLWDKVWAITCVSVAAQLATFPLGVYYFNQLPLLFVLSNLVVIPAAFVAMLLGVFILFSSTFSGLLSALLGGLLNLVLWTMNESVMFIEQLPLSQIDGIQVDLTQTILLFATVALLSVFSIKKRIGLLVIVTGCIMGIGMIELFQTVETSQTREVVFYDTGRQCLIDFCDGLEATLFASETVDVNETIRFAVAGNRALKNLPFEQIPIRSLDDWLSPVEGLQVKRWGGFDFVRLSHKSWSSWQFQERISINYLIVSNNSVLEMEPLLQRFKFDQMIIDGSNTYYRTAHLMSQANGLGINAHSVRLGGALSIKLK